MKILMIKIFLKLNTFLKNMMIFSINESLFFSAQIAQKINKIFIEAFCVMYFHRDKFESASNSEK